ncbi:3-hydroxyacyl-CoA dehydrogenase NAD-binding domain-containing protein [soil metagenome]
MPDTIAVVGTGQIGASWAAYFLAQGFAVSATDPGPGAEERLRAAVDLAWPALEVIGLAPGASREHLRFTPDAGEAVAGAVFVQESGPERLDVKHAVNAVIEASVGPDVIIASSTSGLLISEIRAGTAHPERFVVGHPYNPPHLIPLVEVVGGPLTSEDAVARAMEFYATIGKKPIRLRRELRGHVANRLQVAVWREAFALVQAGVISVADLDVAMSEGPGLRWALLGPFLNLHASGGPAGIQHTLEHLGGPMREWAADLGGFPADDGYIATMAEGVDEELDGRDFADLLARRDEVLLRLLADKRATGLTAP